MRQVVLFCAVIAAGFMAVGCASTDKQIDYLSANSWKLIELEGDFPAIEQGDSYTVTFNPKDSTIFGQALCNRFMGRYSVAKDGTIDIGTLATTMMYCPGGENESTFLEVLELADRFSIERGVLSLHKGGIVIAMFEMMPLVADEKPDVVGTYKGTLPAADCPGIRTTVVVNEDGTYTMTMDYIDRNTVNTEQGTYVVQADTLVLIGEQKGSNPQFLIGEQTITWLDGQGNVIEGELADMFVLSKE